MARVIGLDLGTYSVKAVGLATTLRGFQTSGAWERRIAPPSEGQTLLEQRAEAARALFQENGLGADTLVCGVSGTDAVTRLIHLPFTDARKIEQVLPFEVGEQIPFDLDEVVLDHQVVSTREGGSDILVAAMAKDEFGNILEALKGAAIDPRVMCLDTLALMYLANQVLTSDPGPYAIVDLGHTTTSVVVLGQGGLQFVRTISRGGAAVTEAIAKDLGVERDPAEEIKHRYGQWDDDDGYAVDPERIRAAADRALRPLLADLRQTLWAHGALRRGKVERFYLIGGTSRLFGVDSMLSAGLGVEVKHLDPLQGPLASTAGAKPLADVIPKALSLGLRAVSSAKGPQMNLRTGEFGFRGDFQYLRGRVIQLSVGIVAILVLLGVYAFARYYTLSKYSQRQKNLLAEVTKQTLGKEVKEFSVAHNRITRGGARASLGALLPKVTALDYLIALSKNIGKQKIDVKRLDIGQSRISMTGEIDTIGGLDTVVQSLSKYRCFDKKVRIMKSGKNQLNNRANFQLLITPSC